MKRDLMSMALDLGNELIIDNFAGGGGTSTGLEAAFGRPVDIAINHDPEALAMHAINHPYTKHLCESVWDIDPVEVTGNQPVGLVWLSPDCKHFSKAKGGKPVEKKIRGLAWVTLRWAAKCKPRVIMLENVEEFKTWGPLICDADGNWKPDPARRGKTFDSFIRQLRAHGYHVDHRELRASDHATPTIRKRFFLVARRDGLPIIWPSATHGAPGSPGVRAGKLLPHRTAAECIDWSLDCPSIFDRKKPLADATLRRIAKGIMRYVVDAANPFIVNTANSKTTGRGPNVWSSDEPVRTVTSAPGFAVVSPTLIQTGYGERSGQAPRALDIEKPLGTIVGTAKAALVTAFLNEHANASNQRVMPADEPLRTICAQVKGGHFSMVSATLVDAAHGEVSPNGVRRWGSGAKPVDEPLGTVVASGNKALGVAFLAKHYTGVVGSDLADPIGTVTSTDHHSLVSAHLTKFRTGSVGNDLAEPAPTITAGGETARPGTSNVMGMVTAHIQRDMGQSIGHAVDAPLGTVTAGGGGKSALVSSSLIKLRGTSSTAGMDEPLHTVSAGGQHHAEVRAFLLAYYGTDQDQSTGAPLATVTSRDRFGLVTIKGQDYQIVDIGLRMLAPHELYRAQGFPADYIIDEIPDPALLFADGHQATANPLTIPRIRLTKSAQVRMCGNSVCPPLSEALIRANFAHEHLIAGRAA